MFGSNSRSHATQSSSLAPPPGSMLKSQVPGSFLNSGPSFLKGNKQQNMSMRGTRRSRSNRKKEDKARIWLNGKDVTPRTLGASAEALNSKVLSLIGFANSIDTRGLDIEAGHLHMPSHEGNLASPGGSENSFHGDSLDHRFNGVTEPVVVSSEEPTDSQRSAEEQDDVVDIEIHETDTVTLFHLPSTLVWSEDKQDMDATVSSNEAYQKVLEEHRANDKYVHRPMQTFNETQRNKEVEALPPPTRDIGVQADTWSIYDSYVNNDKKVDDDEIALSLGTLHRAADGPVVSDDALGLDDGAPSGGNSASMSHSGFAAGGSSSEATDSVIKSTRSNSQLAPGRGSTAADGTQTTSATGNPSNDLMDKLRALPRFRNSLRLMEYALVQSRMHQKQLLYREADGPNSEAEGASLLLQTLEAERKTSESKTLPQDSADVPVKARPYLTPLWSYASEQTKDRRVACMDWNKANPDLLAVGYGDAHFGNTSTGLILFWSLRNPTYAEKRIVTDCSVTALAFCSEFPHMLAVGFYNGNVAMYDIRESGDKPAMHSQHASGKHSEPVWGLKWVHKGLNEGGQHLVSVSTDGTVLQWSMKKGLVPHPIMLLKRFPNLAQLQGGKENLLDGISRQASGLCLDFPFDDDTQYLVGTEDGVLHKCSVSYNEQPLDNFYGHTGPVHRVRCSPFVADAFLSCSADWTCALWTQKSTKPVLVFQSGQDAVTDIQWAPANSCVFADVTRDGRLEVWNLEESPLDPVIQHKAAKPLSCLLFSQHSPVILAGGQDGSVEVFRINGISIVRKEGQDAQAQRLLEAVHENRSGDVHLSSGTGTATGAGAGGKPSKGKSPASTAAAAGTGTGTATDEQTPVIMINDVQHAT